MTESVVRGSGLAHYNFSPGLVLARKYEVVERVGARHSGELYRLSEQATGIERTAKFFHPRIDPHNRCASHCARKLHRLRHCDILVQYRTQETISVAGRDVTFLVAEAVSGRPLAALAGAARGGHLSWFEALHLLHALALGLEKVHAAGEAHGDLTLDNVLARRRGLAFQVKLLDLNPAAGPRSTEIRDDVLAMMGLFLEVAGGVRALARLPAAVKAVVADLRRAVAEGRYRDAGAVRRHLEELAWS
jgi:serine/threonine protein kinase